MIILFPDGTLSVPVPLRDERRIGLARREMHPGEPEYDDHLRFAVPARPEHIERRERRLAEEAAPD